MPDSSDSLTSKPYAGLFLDSSSQELLVVWWDTVVRIPRLPCLKADHMTIVFDPTPEQVSDLPLGKLSGVTILGYAADAISQAVLVGPTVKSLNKYPHITVSTAYGESGRHSNFLFNRHCKFVLGPSLTGVVDLRL